MKDTFDSIPSAWFFKEVKHRFGFLTREHRFSLVSEEVDEKFLIPRVTYSLFDFSIIIGRGRGSIRVFAGIQNRKDRIFTTIGEILYFLDTNKLATERIYGYGPDAYWDKPHKERLMNQLDWYAAYINQNLSQILDLFLEEDNEEEREHLYLLIRERRKHLEDHLR
jgi:hypothetical protein